MRVYAITHAEKEAGVNPGLTDKGKVAIMGLEDKLPGGMRHVIIGTGTRFRDTYDYVSAAIDHDQVDAIKYSPLLGSADSGEKSETGFKVMLADGTLVPIGDYVGLIGTTGIDLWMWLNSLLEDTLLCTGREFIGALGVKDAQAGTLYMIDTDATTVVVVT